MSFSHQFNPILLREYDIRGHVGKNLFEEDAYAIGRAFGTMVRREGGHIITLGYDGRLSSPMLQKALTKGLMETGIQVKNIGLGPTPMLYFSVWHLNADAGIMVTGSHNPKEHNGFKMMMGRKAFYGGQIETIGRLASSGDLETGEGSLTHIDIKEAYMNRLRKDYLGDDNLNVVWDAGNGAMAAVLDAFVAKLPGKHRTIFSDIDGNFPNHHPDPTIAKNLIDLQKAVAEEKAQLGIGFDGDGDRIGVVDDEGEIIWGDQLIAIYAKEVLKNHPGATIIADVKASQTLFDAIKQMGGVPLMWKTGHSLIKSKMAEEQSPLAGEMSGHIFFGDKFYGHDDALYCGVRLISILNRSGKKLSDIRKSFPIVYNTPEVRFEVDEDRKFTIVEEVKERLLSSSADVNIIDGVRVNTAQGWWLLRASNTQNVLVVRAESQSKSDLEALKAEIKDQLAKSSVTIQDFAA